MRVQGRVAQPPERGRAVPGRGHRRRRHPARRVRDRRAPDRHPRLAALRRRRPRSGRSRYLLEHAVAGIGHYGNSIGVATVGGEIYFEEPYEQNCLINAMCVGLIERDKLIRSAAAGVGNVLVLFGARTGRDGIGGASVLASAELGDADADKRPTVQIGDPFEEKKLLECSLELLDGDLLVALQDLGAAGPDLVGVRDGGQGRRRARHRRAARAAARGRHGAVRDHDLRVAGADALRRRARPARRRARRLRALGGQRDRDRRGHRRRPAARLRRRRAGRRPAGQRAGRRVPGLRPRAAPSRRRRSTRRRRARSPRASTSPTRCSACSAAPTSPPAAGRSSSTTASSARAPRGGRSRRTPPCSCCPTSRPVRGPRV